MKDVKDGGKPHVLTSSFSLHPSAFQIWGARAAQLGVLAAAPLAWTVTLAEESAESWNAAGLVYAVLAVAALGLGLFVAGLPEMFRRGEVARRFARAEWRNLRAKRGVIGRVLWRLVAVAGWTALVIYLNWFSEGTYRGYGSYGGGLRHSELLTWMSLGCLGFSALLPVVVAASAAVNLAASRRSGAAEHLLMGPLAAEHLGWAATNAQARRGARILLLMLPCYAAGALMFADPLCRSYWTDAAFVALWPLAAMILLEMMMVRRAAALGIWLGAALSSPAAAAALAAVGGLGFWLARLGVFYLALFAAHEFSWPFYWETTLFVGLGAFVVAEWFAFAALTPLLMWLARSSLAAPAGLRLAGWLQRLGGRVSAWGERLESGGAARGAAGAARAFLGGWLALRDPRPMGWKTKVLAAAAFALMVSLSFPIIGLIGYEWGSYTYGPTGSHRQLWENTDILFWTVVLCWVLVFVLSRALWRWLLGRMAAAGDEAREPRQ